MGWSLNWVPPPKKRAALRSDLLLWSWWTWDEDLLMVPYKSGLDQLPWLLRLALILKSDGNETVSIHGNSPRDRQRNKLLIEHQVVENLRSHWRSHPDKLTGKWQKADEYLAPKQPSASLGCSQNETVEWAINSLKCILLLCPKDSTATLGKLDGGEKQMPKIQPSLSHRNK